MINLKSLRNKKVGVLGLEKTGLSVIKAVEQAGGSLICWDDDEEKRDKVKFNGVFIFTLLLKLHEIKKANIICNKMTFIQKGTLRLSNPVLSLTVSSTLASASASFSAITLLLKNYNLFFKLTAT